MTTMDSNSTNLRLMFEKVMNDGNESLMTLLSSPRSRVTPADMDFIRGIANYSSDKLSRERAQLSTELDGLHRNMQSDVLVSDRSVEPSVESIDAILQHEVRDIWADLKGLTVTLPSNGTMMNSFRDEKQRVKCLMSNLDPISDFLEIPQLMEQCVNAKQFGEALALYDYFHRVTKKYSLVDNKLVQTLYSQLQTIRESLIADVERTLSTQNLKVHEVNNLLLIYRLLFPLENLRAKFLHFRLAYYFHRKESAVLAAASAANAAREFIELIRVQLTDIVNQFKTLFPTEFETSIELSRFILMEVNDFFRLFEESIRSIPSDQLFNQVGEMYKMLVFVRPFQLNSKVNHIVHSVLSQRIELACADMVECFKYEIASYNWKPFMSLIPEDGDGRHIIQLTRNKPTAVLYNDVTNVLNDLRQFPMWSLRETFLLLLDQALMQCLEILSTTSVTSEELNSMRSNFCGILVPVSEGNLGAIFDFKPVFQTVRSHSRFILLEDPEPTAPSGSDKEVDATSQSVFPLNSE